MQFHQVAEQPHTYIVEDDYGKQLGTVDEFHPGNDAPGGFAGRTLYIALRFDGSGMFEEKAFSGFTAALLFVEKGNSNSN